MWQTSTTDLPRPGGITRNRPDKPLHPNRVLLACKKKVLLPQRMALLPSSRNRQLKHSTSEWKACRQNSCRLGAFAVSGNGIVFATESLHSNGRGSNTARSVPSPIKFFKVSDIDHGMRCRTGQSEAAPLALPACGTERYAGCLHARISTGILGGCCRDRAAALSEVQPESHAALEAWGGTIWFQSPYIRVPEMRSRAHDGGIPRPHELR
jgi:hypothetical protein